MDPNGEGRRPSLQAAKIGMLLTALVLAAGCRRGSCADVPTTADGCRERCHDRGAEMAFFRYDPGRYPCDAVCECEP
jgi:hypothetical protein